MTSDQVKQLVTMLASAWPRPPVEAATVHVYAYALADLDHEAAMGAVMGLMQTSRFFPTIAEIRERAVKNRVDLPTPELAWGIVYRAIQRFGAHRVPEFDCDEIQEAVKAIGWKNLCLSENEVADRARFIDAMKAALAKRMHAEATGCYTPPARQLPANTVPLSGQGDPLVRVETGYGTDLEQRLALIGVTAAQLEASDAAMGELPDNVVEMLARFPSTRAS